MYENKKYIKFRRDIREIEGMKIMKKINKADHLKRLLNLIKHYHSKQKKKRIIIKFRNKTESTSSWLMDMKGVIKKY